MFRKIATTLALSIGLATAQGRLPWGIATSAPMLAGQQTPGVFYVSSYYGQGTHTDYDIARQAADAYAVANPQTGSILILNPTTNVTCDAVPLPSLGAQSGMAGTTSIIGYGSNVSSIVKSSQCSASAATFSHPVAPGPQLSSGRYQGFTVNANHIDLAACEMYGMASTTFMDVACGNAAGGDHELEFGSTQANGALQSIVVYNLKSFDSTGVGAGAQLTPNFTAGSLQSVTVTSPGTKAYTANVRALVFGPDAASCSVLPSLAPTLGPDGLVNGASILNPGSCVSTANLYILIQDGAPMTYGMKFSQVSKSHIWNLEATGAATYGEAWLTGSGSNLIYGEHPYTHQTIQIADWASGNSHVGTFFDGPGEYGAALYGQSGTISDAIFSWDAGTYVGSSGYLFAPTPSVNTNWRIVNSQCTNQTSNFTPLTTASGAVASTATMPRGISFQDVESCNDNTAAVTPPSTGPTGATPPGGSGPLGGSMPLVAAADLTQAPPTQGPVAGTSLWYWTTESSGASIDTVQGFVTYWVPQPTTNFRFVFGNAHSGSEACGPQMSIRAAVEYPLDSGNFIPLLFNGARDMNVAPCGMVANDPLTIQTSAGGQLLRLRYKVTRAAGDGTIFPANWSFGNVLGSAMLAPYATSTAGAHFDGAEELRTRTIADGVCVGSSTIFTSATAAFTPQDAGQAIVLTGCGPSGSNLATTIASYTSATTVVLATAANTSMANVATTITPSDKTTTGTIFDAQGRRTIYAPLALLGTPLGSIQTAACLGDSISQGVGSNLAYGSWCTQAMDQAGAMNGLAPSVNTGIPYINVAQSGETLANLALPNTHNSRFRLLSQAKYTMGMLGTNDFGTTALATDQANWIKVMQEERATGTLPYYATVIPQTTSTDGWLTLANQTPTGAMRTRVSFNNWLRDGAPMDCTSSAVQPTGTRSSNAARAPYYDGTGKLVNAGSGPCAHPAAGIFELADTVESSRDSGLWKVDPGVTSVTGCSVTAGTNQKMTCPGANFPLSWISGVQMALTGAGPGGTTWTGTAVLSNSTTLMLSGAVNTTVSGQTATFDAVENNLSGRYTVDGTHPSARGHRLMSTTGGNQVANWTW